MTFHVTRTAAICGMQIEKFNDVKVGDVIECFVMEQI